MGPGCARPSGSVKILPFVLIRRPTGAGTVRRASPILCFNASRMFKIAVFITFYAFRTLNLNRIWLHVFEFNERALRAYEKVGFVREGVLRQDVFREGRYWNTVVMGILRDEWLPAVRASD